MQIRNVVTCFLRHPEQRTVLLGQRSRDVRTYPLHYAAISGSVEDEKPLKRALIEIEEETGLDQEQVRLRGEGWPVRFADWELETVWVVLPFLFECLDPASIRRNWEHLQFEWAPPENISGLDTVPKLDKAWESAREAAAAGGRYPSGRIFDMILKDRTHGASELGLWALQALKTATQETFDEGSGNAREMIRGHCRRAAELRPSMATTLTAALRAWEALRDLDMNEQSARTRAIGQLEKLIETRGQAAIQAGERAAERLPAGTHIVTISSSFTILACLKEAASKIDRLTVAESRPACEGRTTAETASSFGIETELMTDAGACSVLTEADLAVFGADSLRSDGAVVNKTGTLALCASASLLEKRSLAVTTSDKILPRGQRPGIEEMGHEQFGGVPAGVKVRNPAFELVPHRAIETIMLESGVAERGLLERKASVFGRLAEDLGA